MTLHSDVWDAFLATFIDSVSSSALTVLMLGLEGFDTRCTDQFANELGGIVPPTVKLLFVRFCPPFDLTTCRSAELLNSLAANLRARNCAPWVFVDNLSHAWMAPAVDVFARGLDRRLWEHPGQLIRSMRWSDVLRRYRHAHDRTRGEPPIITYIDAGPAVGSGSIAHSWQSLQRFSLARNTYLIIQ